MLEKVTRYISYSYICNIFRCNKQLIFFCCFGVINTAIDFFVYLFLTRSFELFTIYFLFAHIISFVISVTNGFFLNRRWTFHSKDKRIFKEYFRYITISSCMLVLSTLLLYVFVNVVGLYDIIAKLVVVVLLAFISFYLHKFLTFKG